MRPGQAPPPYTRMFYLLPFLLAVIALLTVFQVRPVRIATEWSRERVRLVVTVLATALLYEGVLLRSDSAHLTGTLLIVPGLVVMTAPCCRGYWASSGADGRGRGRGNGPRVVRAAAP